MRTFPTFLSLFTIFFFLCPLLCLSERTFLGNAEKISTIAYKLPDKILRRGEAVSSSDLIVQRMAALDLRGYRPEALKAVAVAAGTELRIRYQTDGTADHYDCLTPDEAKTAWGDAWFKADWPQLEQAVSATWGQILIQNSDLFFPACFPLSWGQTVAGVECPYDFTAEGFETEISVSASKAKKIFPDFEASLTVKKARNGRVETVTSGNTVLSGEEVAKAFALPSLSFSSRTEEGRLIFTCNGIGNGEGMSLYGANEEAKRGKTYSEILSYFYPEATLSPSALQGSDNSRSG